MVIDHTGPYTVSLPACALKLYVLTYRGLAVHIEPPLVWEWPWGGMACWVVPDWCLPTTRGTQRVQTLSAYRRPDGGGL